MYKKKLTMIIIFALMTDCYATDCLEIERPPERMGSRFGSLGYEVASEPTPTSPQLRRGASANSFIDTFIKNVRKFKVDYVSETDIAAFKPFLRGHLTGDETKEAMLKWIEHINKTPDDQASGFAKEIYTYLEDQKTLSKTHDNEGASYENCLCQNCIYYSVAIRGMKVLGFDSYQPTRALVDH